MRVAALVILLATALLPAQTLEPQATKPARTTQSTNLENPRLLTLDGKILRRWQGPHEITALRATIKQTVPPGIYLLATPHGPTVVFQSNP